jgi:predicted transcriptional regulator
MTNKEIVQDLLQRIPDDASLHDIARELEFIAAVRQGLAELDNGQSVSVEENDAFEASVGVEVE